MNSVSKMLEKPCKMTPDSNFESMSYNPFSVKDGFANSDNDPDINFYQDISSLDTHYFTPNDFQDNFKCFYENTFSLLHLNIRSINKNFETFKQFYSSLNFTFSIICFSETWVDDDSINKNSLFQLQNYNVLHQIRNNRKGGGLCIFVHESLCYKLRKDLSINSDAIESLSIEITNKNSKNIIFNVIYRPPNGDMEACENYCKELFSKNDKSLKNMILAGDFNVNLLDFEHNKKVQSFLNLIFCYSMIPTTNKPTRVTRNTATAIDHIITNCIVGCDDFKTGIIKADLTDHFPIVIALKSHEKNELKPNEQYIYKRYYRNNEIEYFKLRLHEINWDDIKRCQDPNKAYELFFDTFISIYDTCFPKIKVKLKTKNNQSPWITKAIIKSSKKKQKLYEKFLKNRTLENERVYKVYNNLFETIKRKAKKKYYSEKLLKFKGDAKKTWSVMKELIGKSKTEFSNLPQKISIDKKNIFDERKIANEFNNFFTNIGINLASKIPSATKPFETYVTRVDSEMETKSLSVNELKDAYFSLKINKSSGYDDVNYNVIKKCFGELCEPLKYLFDLSIQKGIFPDDLKIAQVTPIFKAGDSSELSNYRPISVLPCFSKILERIMYNHLHKFLNDTKILYQKQFGFRTGHSTDHAIVQLVDQIFESFENNEFTLGVFIDLSKAFDTVDHSILLRKLKLYGITDINHDWFKSYLSNRKQYIQINDKGNTELGSVKCGVPQGSILGPLLFLLYVNDLKNASDLLDPIMFADDTNLFCTHRDIKYLFSTVNNELEKINEWFISNKLSLNVEKTKYSFFHKPSKKEDIPLVLPKLKVSDHEIERVDSIKFLGVFLDENLTWKEHIRYTENKIAKNIGLMYKAKHYLDKKSLLTLYYPYVHTYVNYANIAWGSTNRTNLKKINSQQKHAIRIVYNKDRFSHTRKLFRENKILNVYQLNILNNLMFMQRIKLQTAPIIFLSKFQKPSHNYPTTYSINNYVVPSSKLIKCKYRISIRGPTLWKDTITMREKQLESIGLFKNSVKQRLLAAENETDYF